MGCGDAVGEGRCVCREAEWMNLMKSAREGPHLTDHSKDLQEDPRNRVQQFKLSKA